MIRDRIKSLRRVKASALKANPRNWRQHPDSQRTALESVLSEVGYADALLARELPDGSLELVDGHLRAELDPDQKVPVLILDLTEEEADKILATLDPLAGLAETDDQKLGELLASIETENEGLADLLHELAESEGLDIFEPVSEEEPPEPQIDRAAELQEKWGTELGQLWVIGEHRLLCGDSTKWEDLERATGGKPFDALLTDPPYSSGGQFRGDRTQKVAAKYVQTNAENTCRTDFAGDNRDQRAFVTWASMWLSEAFAYSKPGGIAMVFSDWRQLPSMTDALQCGGWV